MLLQRVSSEIFSTNLRLLPFFFLPLHYERIVLHHFEANVATMVGQHNVADGWAVHAGARTKRMGEGSRAW